MPARRRQLERPPAALLAADVGKVDRDDRRATALPRGGRLDRLVAAQVPDRLDQMPDADRLDSGEGSLAGRRGGAQHA